MSLQLAAQHMASRGRGPDTQLVHMAPQEVAGLQALAKAHGGSLTTNPDTGLPEAGFLSNLLPTVIGAGLSIASGGTLTPLMAGMMTGAGYGIASGSLKKGLMAGFGAYGGAGLAGGLMGAGAAGAAGAAAPAGAAASEMAATNAALQQNALTGLGVPSNAAAGTGSMSFAPNMSTDVLGATRLAGPMSVPVTAGAPSAAQLTAGVPQVATATPVPTAATSIGDRFSQAGRGLQSLLTDEGRTAFMGNEASKGVAATGIGGTKGLMRYGMAAAAPMLMAQDQKEEKRPDNKPYEYGFSYNRVENPNAGYTGPYTGERTYFNPTFTRKAADGGLMDTGPVQSMSDQNQAEMLMINRGQRFDAGGAVGRVEDNPYYTMTGQSGDAFRYLMGQGGRPTAPAAPQVSAPTTSTASSSTPGAVTGETLKGVDAEYVYEFDPATGLYTPVVKAKKEAAPAKAEQSSGGDSANTGLTKEQAQVFDFMNTPAGAQYKEAFGAANNSLIGSLMPGSFITGAIKGEFTNPFTAFREAQNVFSAAGQAARADRIGNLPTGYEGVGGPGTYSSPSGGYPGGVTGYQTGENGLPSELGGSAAPGSDATSSTPDSSPSTDSGGYSGETYAYGGLAALARGGQSHLGDYSDGGRLLRGPGDGVSDSIPASIGNKRPARLADGEFVVPARIVSELGNGSTEAGARKLYAMMDRVQKARKKSIGKNRVAVNSRADKLLPV